MARRLKESIEGTDPGDEARGGNAGAPGIGIDAKVAAAILELGPGRCSWPYAMDAEFLTALAKQGVAAYPRVTQNSIEDVTGPDGLGISKMLVEYTLYDADASKFPQDSESKYKRSVLVLETVSMFPGEAPGDSHTAPGPNNDAASAQEYQPSAAVSKPVAVPDPIPVATGSQPQSPLLNRACVIKKMERHGASYRLVVGNNADPERILYYPLKNSSVELKEIKSRIGKPGADFPLECSVNLRQESDELVIVEFCPGSPATPAQKAA